jgi:hypothetical protein
MLAMPVLLDYTKISGIFPLCFDLGKQMAMIAIFTGKTHLRSDGAMASARLTKTFNILLLTSP